MSGRCWAIAWVLLLAAAGAADARTMVVHLPSAPVEAASRQAEAVAALVEALSQRLPGGLEPKIFRRWRDARIYLNESPEAVVLLLTDASFMRQPPAGFVPAFRFVRGGRSTYRRLLVVRADRPELEKLVDLRGSSLAVVETAGDGDRAFLEREIFEDELEPAAWFGELESTVDDFEATASVLYGQTDAALVAEYNPLLTAHLGSDLDTVFESPELSLPVLSLSETAVGPAERSELERAIAGLAGQPAARQALADLGFEALAALPGDGLAPRSAERVKAFEIAAPEGPVLELDVPPLPEPRHLVFGLAVELPDVPLRLDDD